MLGKSCAALFQAVNHFNIGNLKNNYHFTAESDEATEKLMDSEHLE